MDLTRKTGVAASVSSVVSSDEGSCGSSTGGCKTRQQVTLSDLCPADKEKVANLIRELAKLGSLYFSRVYWPRTHGFQWLKNKETRNLYLGPTRMLGINNNILNRVFI